MNLNKLIKSDQKILNKLYQLAIDQAFYSWLQFHMPPIIKSNFKPDGKLLIPGNITKE